MLRTDVSSHRRTDILYHSPHSLYPSLDALSVQQKGDK